ncbi:MAG: serine/threonine-protein kinase [Leptolyngbyaceae bacterium]|nr:serine/threonine-protein kinase [Leptolyngbyaceae bacterium]
METYCTRPKCPRPSNTFPDLNNKNILKTVQQKFCTTCGMPQILIGRYVPIKLLGQGGFGAAFLAIDRYTPTMRHCVVKQFLPSGNLSPDQLELAQKLFEREAEALENLGNPHAQIPNLLAYFELDVPATSSNQPTQFFYLVQEFIDGENMEQMLERKGKFSQAETLFVLREVLSILTFVHENGAIHRDIKPSNIMRDRKGRIYLLDFGAVKQVTSSPGSAQGHSTGIYSMGFAPPEQMSGGVVYPATDLYALGVTCITLLTGKQPMELYDAYSNTWNWRAYVQVDDLLEAVLNRMLLPVPSDRFQSANEVLAALNRHSSQVSAGQQQTPQQTPAQQTSLQPPPPPPPSQTPPPPPAQTPSAQTPSPPSRSSAGAKPSPPQAKPVARPLTPPPPPPRFLDDPIAILSGAFFIGFEMTVLAIATISVIGNSVVSIAVLALLMAALAILVVRRVIEKTDLLILMVLTLLVALLIEGVSNFSILQPIGASPLILLMFLPVMGGLVLLAASILFLLIYRVLEQLL